MHTAVNPHATAFNAGDAPQATRRIAHALGVEGMLTEQSAEPSNLISAVIE